jgi:hypothetical protein
VHPTLGIRRHFQAFSYASAFFQSDGVPPPAPAPVTQTVGRLPCKTGVKKEDSWKQKNQFDFFKVKRSNSKWTKIYESKFSTA